MTQRPSRFLLLALVVILGVPLLGLISQTAMRGGNSLSMTQRQGVSGVAPMVAEQGRTDMPAGRPQLDMATDDVVRSTASKIMMVPPQPPMTDGFVPGNDRVIVKTAQLSLLVDDVRAAAQQVTDLISKREGLITSTSIYENQRFKGSLTATISIRVPVAQLESTVEELRKLAKKIVVDEVTAQDETKQKVDLEAQLRNLRATESQLLAIMRQAKNVEETLQVQRELSSIRGQIELMDAQLQNLTNNAAMSSIQLTLETQDTSVPAVSSQQNSILEEIKIALRDMVRIYRGLFIQGTRTAILLLPLIIIGVIAWFIWQRQSRKP